MCTMYRDVGLTFKPPVEAIFHYHQLDLLLFSSAPGFVVDSVSKLQLFGEQDINGRHDHQNLVGKLVDSSLAGTCPGIIDVLWSCRRSIGIEKRQEE